MRSVIPSCFFNPRVFTKSSYKWEKAWEVRPAMWLLISGVCYWGSNLGGFLYSQLLCPRQDYKNPRTIHKVTFLLAIILLFVSQLWTYHQIFFTTLILYSMQRFSLESQIRRTLSRWFTWKSTLMHRSQHIKTSQQFTWQKNQNWVHTFVDH